MPAIYSIDLIAKRDKKTKMDRSIVKGWNVHYQTLEEVEEEERIKKQQMEEEKAKEIYERLSREAEDDDDEKNLEIAVAKQFSKDAYNAKTGSYSGHYGQEPVKDEAAKQQIDAILSEKPDAFDSALTALQGQDGEG